MADPMKKVQPGETLAIPTAAQDAFIDAAEAIVTKPVAVYVEKVYKEGDFARLGIGT